ncbi:hypothetical protein [Devosia sp. A369]
MFDALSTVEPPGLDLATARILEATDPARDACLSSRIASETGWASFLIALVMPADSMVCSALAT